MLRSHVFTVRVIYVSIYRGHVLRPLILRRHVLCHHSCPPRIYILRSFHSNSFPFLCYCPKYSQIACDLKSQRIKLENSIYINSRKSISFKYAVKPEFSDTLAIKDGRHPILEKMSPNKLVPNNTVREISV